MPICSALLVTLHIRLLHIAYPRLAGASPTERKTGPWVDITISKVIGLIGGEGVSSFRPPGWIDSQCHRSVLTGEGVNVADCVPESIGGPDLPDDHRGSTPQAFSWFFRIFLRSPIATPSDCVEATSSSCVPGLRTLLMEFHFPASS